MKKKNILITILAAGAFLLVGLQAVSVAMSKGHMGYLADALCAEKKVSAGGFNLITSPEKHTVACMNMPPCLKSGFGVFLKDDASGNYVFHKFDAKGTELAKAMLKKTDRTDNMKISVNGVFQNGIVMVDSISEV